MIKAPILAPSPPPETTSQILALPLLSQEDAGTRQFEPFPEPRGRQYGPPPPPPKLCVCRREPRSRGFEAACGVCEQWRRCHPLQPKPPSELTRSSLQSRPADMEATKGGQALGNHNTEQNGSAVEQV